MQLTKNLSVAVFVTIAKEIINSITQHSLCKRSKEKNEAESKYFNSRGRFDLTLP